MALTTRWANFALTTGSDNGTSEADAWRTWSSLHAGVSANTLVNCKGPETDTILFDWTTSGTQVNGIIWLRGYATTAGDGGLCEIANPLRVDAEFIVWDGFKSTITGATTRNMQFISIVESRNMVQNCVFHQTDTGSGNLGCVSVSDSKSRTTVRNCYMKADGTNNWIAEIGGQSMFHGCFIEGIDGDMDGIMMNGDGQEFVIANNIIANSGDTGINNIGTPCGVWIMNNTIYNSSEGGIVMNVNADSLYVIANNIIAVHGAWGIENTAATDVMQCKRYNNAITSDGSGIEDGFGDDPHFDLIDLGSVAGSTIFEDPAGGNFAPRKGHAVLGAAFPSSFPSINGPNAPTTSSRMDLGASQRTQQEATLFPFAALKRVKKVYG